MKANFSRPWGESGAKCTAQRERRRIALSELLLSLLFCFSGCGVAFAQERTGGSETGSGQETRTQNAREGRTSGAVRGADLVSDNLDRVAASAEQILELLNRDAGLMVEFKRLLAQDAGADGQILDESDLTDEAVQERLNEDLRARVLATRLLQRYGYLLPKVNPNSDLAAEHNLILQDRAYAIAHAAEPSTESRAYPPASQTSGCDSQGWPDCEFIGRGSNRGSGPAYNEGQQNRLGEQLAPNQGNPRTASPTSPGAQPQLRADLSTPR